MPWLLSWLVWWLTAIGSAALFMAVYGRIFAQPSVTSELSDLKVQISALADSLKSFTTTFYNLQQQLSALESKFDMESEQTNAYIKRLESNHRETYTKLSNLSETVEKHRHLAICDQATNDERHDTVQIGVHDVTKEVNALIAKVDHLQEGAHVHGHAAHADHAHG
eukprot:CAMPEP_0202871200 /NCGR_PEP_ID=MMETSP1391-20130828/18069_1 /ASSEMBLY_ACC=CAM_ASM_000867 /TAXON_ID=1034604 /ORGANISM="Chlamydomonas leiostraca, Strain SAG 11-49" /LENGTH=165 /DNA_ID=CAMNT_0049551931 /DNA_START=329 /DNA_END=823 /DNA_ORIENTATION=-